MPPAPTSQLSLLVEAVEAGPGGPEAVEQFARDLRAELSDLGVRRVEQVPAGPPPDGTRAVELLAICGFVITMAQTGEALTKMVRAVRVLARKYAERRQPLRLTVDGSGVDLATAADEELESVVAALLARPARPARGVRSALIIANDGYDDARLAQLRSPGHDAEALARVLGDPAIGGFEVELLANSDERTIRRRIAAFFADRDRDDLLLLHFSCHGVKDVRGRLHLAARDTDLSVLGATAIPASFVNDLLADTQSRRVVLILDCCYSGAFARGTGVRSDSEVHIADEFGAGSGRIVLTASSATEYAFEGNELTQSAGQPSAFTSALVNGLSSGAADLDADGEISIDELYDYTYRTVRETTPGQAPMKWTFGVEGNVVIARSVRPAALPAGIIDDLASDRVVLRLEAVRALTDLLRGGRPGLRQAAHTALLEVRDNDDSVRVREAASATLADVSSTVDASARVTVHRPTDSPAVPRQRPDLPRTEASPTEAAQTEAARTEAPPAETVRAQTAPSDPAPSAPASRWLVMPVAAAALTLASIVCYVVANPKDAASTWYTDLIWLPELVAIVAVLATRRVAWAGLLAGLVSWDWLLLALFPHSGVVDTVPGWRWLVAGAAIAGAAQLCALTAVVRAGLRAARPVGRSMTGWALGTGVVLTLLALLTANTGGRTLILAFSLSLDDFGWLRVIATVLCALAVPVAVLGARSGPTAPLVLVGWLLAGGQSALIDILGGYEPRSAVWAVLGLTAATATGGYLSVALRSRLARRAAGASGSATR
jgi:hypothetical protein